MNHRIISAALALALTLAVAWAVAGFGPPTASEAAARSARPAHPALPGHPARLAAEPSAGIGDTIALSGIDSDEEVAVTVTKVVDPARASEDGIPASAGDRLVGVQLKLHNTGSSGYSDAPDNGAVLVDESGQSFSSSYNSIRSGPGFPGAVDISPGDTRLGYVVFDVPRSSNPQTFQFALDSGFADQKGEWSVTGAGGKAPDESEVVDVVRDYFDAINDADYQRAWDLGGKNFGQSYETFVDGFSETAHDTVTIVSTSGNVVRIRLDAEQTDGSHRTYAGPMRVSDGEIVSANLHRT